MTNLTQNEITALKTCLNYKTREGQLNDNYSNGGQEEFKQALGWNDKQVAALIGSLEDKNMGYGDDNQGNGHIFWLSDLGVNTIFNIIEAENASEELLPSTLEHIDECLKKQDLHDAASELLRVLKVAKTELDYLGYKETGMVMYEINKAINKAEGK